MEQLFYSIVVMQLFAVFMGPNSSLYIHGGVRRNSHSIVVKCTFLLSFFMGPNRGLSIHW